MTFTDDDLNISDQDIADITSRLANLQNADPIAVAIRAAVAKVNDYTLRYQISEVIQLEPLTPASVQGQTYFAQRQDLSSVSVQSGSGQVFNTPADYTLNAAAGSITVVVNGAIANPTALFINYTSDSRFKRLVRPIVLWDLYGQMGPRASNIVDQYKDAIAELTAIRDGKFPDLIEKTIPDPQLSPAKGAYGGTRHVRFTRGPRFGDDDDD
jgi:hypothetical protein